MITAIYLRTSTNYQQTGLEAQERAIKEYCKQKGIKNVEIFKDFGVSGKKASRPSLNKLMEKVRNNEIRAVIVYSFSRFARSTKHLLEALSEFDKTSTSFISLTENIDTGSPMGRAMFTIISALAQLERELISERVKNGLNNARAKGKQIGRKKIRNSALIRELSSQGLSYRSISKLTGSSLGTIARELKGVHK